MTERVINSLVVSASVGKLVKNENVTPGPSDYSTHQSSLIGNDGPSYSWQK